MWKRCILTLKLMVNPREELLWDSLEKLYQNQLKISVRYVPVSVSVFVFVCVSVFAVFFFFFLSFCSDSFLFPHESSVHSTLSSEFNGCVLCSVVLLPLLLLLLMLLSLLLLL